MSEPNTTHPDGTRLDAAAVGQEDDETRAHLASCAACREYVNAVATGADAFAQNEGLQADAFVKAVRRRQAVHQRARHAWAGGVASALALAAGVLLFVRSRGELADRGGELVAQPGEGVVRLKGKPQIAVIVEHAGAQSRHTGDLVLEPGDRIRLELALDHEERIVAGVLTDDGEWAELQPARTLGNGTHYSEQSISFDGDVPRGWVLVGSESAVTRARQSRDFREVSAIGVRQKLP